MAKQFLAFLLLHLHILSVKGTGQQRGPAVVRKEVACANMPTEEIQKKSISMASAQG
jgi:hypothetical protein